MIPAVINTSVILIYLLGGEGSGGEIMNDHYAAKEELISEDELDRR
jgi:hypothetical protein